MTNNEHNRSSGATHPQLSFEELQQVKWLLGGVLTLLAVSTVFYMDVGATLLTGATAVVSAAATLWPNWLARVPRWVHRLAFSFVAAFFTADLWLTGELLPAIVRLGLLLLLYRAITYRRKREDLQVIVLGLFLVVLGGVLSVSLVFAGQILAFTAVALAFLLAITLSDTATKATNGGAARPAPVGEGGPPRWARGVRWWPLLGRIRQVTDWRVVLLGGVLFGGLVALSGLLFVAIPRFQLGGSFFLERFITKQTKTGFSDTIRFGDVTDITQDNSVALSVDVSDRGQVPLSPYWRMLVLDEYRGGTFRLSAGLRRMAMGQERGGVNVRGTAAPEPGEPVYWTFYLESGVSRFLPLLGRFEVLRFREPQNFRFARNLGIIELRSEPATMLAYRVGGMGNSAAVPDETFARHWRERGGPRSTAGALMLQLGVDEADQATLERLVAEITSAQAQNPSGRSEVGRGVPAESVERRLGRGTPAGGEMDAEEFLRRAEAWLESRHDYSLSPRIPAGPGDPLVRWMASTESGHCELFAGSLVLLARAAGLPARVVTGFRGGSWNGYSNNFTLRNSDAHAWCEVFELETGVWLRADPTPGSADAARDEGRGETALAARLDRSWTARLDSLRVFWYRRIVSFDQQSQIETLQAVKDATERSGRRLREVVARWAGVVRDWWSAPWSGGRAARVLAVVVALGGVVTGFWMLRRGGGWRWRIGARRHGGDAVREEAGRWLRRMRAARAEKGEGKKEQEAVLAELQRLRFGAPETWNDPARVFSRARKAWRGARRATKRG